MRTHEPANPVELIPPAPQTLWGKPAVANFVLGGLGAGFYVAAVAFYRAVPIAVSYTHLTLPTILRV